ncbi:eCIS core domain-containing protein [Streptomyces xinghaiensis]|uniref:eCIS core domain-containing protein n=1 Tax=Streptomyces xinghaiensis TaxID=1038928 RepID=UPI00030A66C3|nr:DUF4157 domain-containing protein [Streptomyces xinghaiensis]MZE80289.1 DUF4157 domain-containing protein [Streptomyces sp. SID5475]
MSSHASQDSRAETARNAKRRKRTERSGKNTAPEPKDIVSGAGQPLDLSVRRELEERLGHDFSRVRLHTDRDAGALTDLLGADAIAVGQDIFFREGTYRPGTADGQRLLAHELLHTVQNPDGLGALRAGRDLGAVSLPEQTVEREAESAAQESVRNAMLGSVREDEPAAGVEAGQPTPGWLRYATVDADRRRAELLDPATLVDRLANSIVRSLRGDPEDRSKRTRMQLARLPEDLQESVLDRLEARLLSSEHERVLDLVEEIEDRDDDFGQESHGAPRIEPDLAEELRFQEETRQRSAEEEQQREQRPPTAPGPEKDRSDDGGATGSTPQNGGEQGENATTPQGGSTQEQQPGGADSSGTAAGEQQTESPAAAPAQEAAASRGQGGSADAESDDGAAGGEQKNAEEGAEQTEQESTPAASEEESAARNRPGAAEALVAGQQVKKEDKAGQEKPTGSPTTAGQDTQFSRAVSTLDGVRGQDLDELAEEPDEDPFGQGSRSEVEVGGAPKSAWDIKLQPEDFLPQQDLDVSAVPTADELDPSSSAAPAMPSFPAPPETRADKVQAERDAEDAEDAAAEAEPEEKDHTAGSETPERSPETEGTGPDGQPGGLDLEKPEARPGPGTVSKDPKAGADPKEGPVAAQTAVQEGPAGSEKEEKTEEQSAKEEKGTSAKGEESGKNPEKASQEAAGGQSAEKDPAAEEGKGGPAGESQGQTQQESAEGGGKSEPAAEAQDTSAARDSHVSGGSNADVPGGASSDAASGSQSGPSGGPAQTEESPTTTDAPAARTSAPAAPAPKKAPAAAPAPTAAPKPETEKPKSSPAKSGSAAKAPRGGGGGGGPAKGGRGKGKKKDTGAAPNLSQVSPEAGLSTASTLKPHKAMEAMGGVSGSVDRTVGDEHQQLAASPPSLERPAGAPQTLQGQPKTDAPAQYSEDEAAKSEAPEGEKAEVKGAKEPEGDIEAEKAEEPGGWDTFKMALGFGLGKVASWLGFEVDASELAAKFAGLPTKDEALKQAQAGNAPGVGMKDAADGTADEQGAAVDSKGEDTVATGRDDANRKMGEDQVYPDAPKEQMRAKVPGAQGGKGGGPGGGGAGTGVVPPEAASEVAEHDKGPEFQAAFSKGQSDMSSGRQAKDKDFRVSQQKHKEQVDSEVAKNTESQAGEREKAMSEVTAERENWRTEQDKELESLGTKKTERHEKVRKDVKDKEEETDKDTEKEKEDSDKKIKDKNTEAEKDAEKKRDSSVEESGNWVTKAFDWIKQKVIEIKNAIVSVIKNAREAVIGFIKNFKETVERWINEAREAIVEAIKNFIDDLIEFAKAMVRAVIELANRIRKFITDLIAAAIALVNKLANMLKQIISDLLNAIGKLLSSLLEILRKALLDVVKAVRDAIKTVLEYASKLLAALGDFMLIAVDFLSDPGGWLSGAKNSAVDGSKNHLFAEVKAAVKEWFQSKIEEILGIPKAIIDKLIKGGYTLEKIVKETWDAIVPSLPFIIGEIVITKVVAKLIPGAGWAMAVIDAIRVAIGALGEILRAIGAVITWLKAVRQGGAGVLFAKAVAAGIVALLELAYEALLSGIGKYIGKVGRRLKGVAAKLGKKKDKPGDKKDAGGDGSDPKKNTDKDKGGDKKDQDRPGTQKPTTKTSDTPGSTRPTTTKPKPDTSKPDTKPSTKPDGKPDRKKDTDKPGAKPDTGKPGPKKDQDNTPSTPNRPKGPSDRDGDSTRPRGTDTDTKPKPDKDDDKPATTPPSPKPKPKDKDRDADSTKPKEDTPGKPKNKDDDSTQPKKDDPPSTKPKNKDGDSTKPDKDDDKDGPGRPKSDKDKEERKKEEESPDALDQRLDIITARIRAYLLPKLREGIPENTFDATLIALRNRYRLRSLRAYGNPDIDVIARLNPTSNPVDAVRTDEPGQPQPIIRLEEEERPLPPTDYPDLPPGVRANEVTKVHYLHKPIRQGEPAGAANDKEGENPPGHKKEMRYWPDAIVKMHLIPDKMGGPATGANLVPAPSRTNSRFNTQVETPAVNEAKSSDKSMSWYKAVVQFSHPSPWENFPSRITGSWNTYEPSDKEASGWKEKTATPDKTYSEPVAIPRKPDEDWKIRVSDQYESKTRLKERLTSPRPPIRKPSKRLLEDILEMAQERKFDNADDLLDRLRKKGKYTKDEIDGIEEALRGLDREDLIDYEPLE